MLVFFFNISCPYEESSFNPARSWAEYWRDLFFLINLEPVFRSISYMKKKTHLGRNIMRRSKRLEELGSRHLRVGLY